MRFCVNESPSHLGGRRLLWNLLRLALEREEGVAYFRYPLYRLPTTVPAPEFFVLSRRFGLWLLTCCGERPDGIRPESLQADLVRGQQWCTEIVRQIESEPELRGLSVRCLHCLALPFVNVESWQAQDRAGLLDGRVILPRERLQPDAMRAMFSEQAAGDTERLTDDRWRLLQAALRGRVMPKPRRESPEDLRVPPIARGFGKQVGQRSNWLDETQERVAHEIPEGPQRIRGVAGSGKTTLLAQRAALIHAAHPDWDIAFLVHTRHRRARIEALIAAYFQDFTGLAPDFGRLRVWNAWGDGDSAGFLRTVSQAWEQRLRGPSDAQFRLGWREAGAHGLAWACEELERELLDQEVAPLLDVILIDEGQDMPAALYRLALRALRPPSRLYWAYDESQGLKHLLVPRAANLFGLDATGRPHVDLSGSYPSGIPKSRLLSRSYRTPAVVLGLAQALGMGLLRRGGPLQSVSHRDEWSHLGFEVEGDLSAAGIRAGRGLVIERAAEANAHPMDHLEVDEGELPPGLLEVIEVEEEQVAVAAVVDGVRRDLDEGFAAADLLVIVLPQSQPSPEKLGVALRHAGIPAHVVVDGGEDVEIRGPECVTVSGVEVAAGCEAWKVYVTGLHRVTAESVTTADDETLRRNQALVALTRARMWCVAVGERGPFMAEVMALHRARGRFRFRAFAPSALHRDIDSWVLGRVGDAGRMIELN